MWWAALFIASAQTEQPSDHTVVYYNARMALRERRPLEASKLWLLRNAMEAHTKHVSPHDADFRSVTWAALGDLGICQDGLKPDNGDGAGLWPLALHNWVVRNRGRKSKAKNSNPFNAFDLGRQQRFVAIGDVLSSPELQTVKLSRGACARPRLMAMGQFFSADFGDRELASRMLQSLLEQAQFTLADRVLGTSTIEARLFDIHLQRTSMAAREARRKENEKARKGRQVGLSRASVEALRGDQPTYDFGPSSEPARILMASVNWTTDAWMALSSDRRMFLFDHARAYGEDPPELRETALDIVDRLIEADDGDELQKWIARASADPQDIWGGERGQRLLSMDAESGFDERAVLALHRGVNLLEQGDLQGSLRSMAYAIQYAPESKAGEEVLSLSLRWLTYLAARFEITDELLITLQQLIPRREYSVMLEDLMWAAAFQADRVSFERGMRNQAGRGALERRLELLKPLSGGNVGPFSRGIRDGLRRSPSETMRFLKQFVERLELENADIRVSHIPTLTNIRRFLRPLADGDGNGRQGRTAETLMLRTQAIIEGLGAMPDATDHDRARALDPRSEVYGGSVRLAPSDPLPWPFRRNEVSAPSIFEPIILTPLEWEEDGRLIFGWTLSG